VYLTTRKLEPHFSEISLPITPMLFSEKSVNKIFKSDVSHALISNRRVRRYARRMEDYCEIPKVIHSVSFNDALSFSDFLRKISHLGFQPSGLITLLCVSMLHPELQRFNRILCGDDFCFDVENEKFHYAYALDWDTKVNGSLLDLHNVNEKIDAFTQMIVFPASSGEILIPNRV
jgi:hypothetical protein